MILLVLSVQPDCRLIIAAAGFLTNLEMLPDPVIFREADRVIFVQ
jgi:hypothetical protein